VLCIRAATAAWLLIPVSLTLRRHRLQLGDWIRWRDLRWPIAVGLCDGAGMVLFALAAERGYLSLAALLFSLYPLMIVLLARAFLGERLQTRQALAAAAVMVGVAFSVAA